MTPPASGEFLWPVRVYYEDTDSGGVVYYANYLRFLERARSEWLRGLGFEQDALAAREGVVFMVRGVRIEFLRPARFNDLVTVVSRVASSGRAQIEFEQTIRRDAELLVEARVRVACVAVASGRPTRIPQALLAHLA